MAFNDVMRKAFPFISMAASMGGPIGVMAANAIGKAIGVDKIDPTKLQDVIGTAMANPDQLLALKKADNDFQVQMEQLGINLEEIDEKDRESARQREQVVKDWTPKILAYGVTAGFFGVLLLMFMHSIPDTGHDVLLVLVGSLGSAWIAIMNYYFGSSSGSAAKTQILAAATKK
jgi:hypothetical protein